jgi:cyclopropane fatty-acyl-phospholipid synthase-like methyltransferase
MLRVTEPEIMDDEEQVCAYALADFEEPHSQFIALLGEKLPSLPATGHALDMGCGSGDITRRFALAFPGWKIDGIDGSRAMLISAREMAFKEGIEERLNFMNILLPASPLPDCHYDFIFSNSLLHHLSNPAVFWASLVDWSSEHTYVFVMDLMRPTSPEKAQEIVQRYSAGEPEILRTDFFNSLLAAFEPEEIAEQLEQASLTHLQRESVSDRHIIVWGPIKN